MGDLFFLGGIIEVAPKRLERAREPLLDGGLTHAQDGRDLADAQAVSVAQGEHLPRGGRVVGQCGPDVLKSRVFLAGIGREAGVGECIHIVKRRDLVARGLAQVIDEHVACNRHHPPSDPTAPRVVALDAIDETMQRGGGEFLGIRPDPHTRGHVAVHERVQGGEQRREGTGISALRSPHPAGEAKLCQGANAHRATRPGPRASRPGPRPGARRLRRRSRSHGCRPRPRRPASAR